MIGNNSFVRAKTIGPNVIIGENCKIGEGSVINNNVVILDNSVVAPNSVIPSNCVFGGVPATFVSLLSEQAQSQMGSEIEYRFSQIEQDLASFVAQKIKEKEAKTGDATPSSNLQTPRNFTLPVPDTPTSKDSVVTPVITQSTTEQ